MMRLQIGTSRLENFSPEVRDVFLTDKWIHLGDSEHSPSELDRNSISYVFQVLAMSSPSDIIKKASSKIGALTKTNSTQSEVDDYYSMTNFQPFLYEKGDRLKFEDNQFTFIYSEHFFEHLFFDEAVSLFKECYRMLATGGVMRICVPDADLRTYEAPEPAGYPDPKLSWNHPSKHKMRWSVYSLVESLQLVGFTAAPVAYCDKDGAFINEDLSSKEDIYSDCQDREMLFSLQYVTRKHSLIVDGIKK
jgi:predicted SAM-dependent methyltransferase